MNHYSTTVSQREKEYPKAEVKRARQARELQRVRFFPGLGGLGLTLEGSAVDDLVCC